MNHVIQMSDSCRYLNYSDCTDKDTNAVGCYNQNTDTTVVMHKDTNVSTLSTLAYRQRQVSSTAGTRRIAVTSAERSCRYIT